LAPILLLAVACEGGSIDEAYVSEMNILMTRHLEAYQYLIDENARITSELASSPNLATALELNVEFQSVMDGTDQEFEDVMIQWAALKPTDVSRVFHAKTFEMMQLRADCAVNYRLMIDTFFATDQLDLAIGRHAADLCEEADRVYLDVLAEGRKVDKALYK